MDTDGIVSKGINRVVKRHFQGLGGSDEFTLDDFVHGVGKAADACLYWALFCPAFLEVDGSVLLERAVETAEEQARFRRARSVDGRQAAESSFNFVEVPYLFGPEGRNLSDEEDYVLAQAIARAWQAWLGFRYPQRMFVVKLIEPSETGSVVGIQFWERL